MVMENPKIKNGRFGEKNPIGNQLFVGCHHDESQSMDLGISVIVPTIEIKGFSDHSPK
jgi:hypothetical protein